MRGFRGGFSRQAFARQQGQSFVNRHLVLPRHAVEAFLLAFLGEFRAQIAVHAGHVLRADDLDADLFQGVVGVFRLAPRRHAGRVDAVVMMA